MKEGVVSWSARFAPGALEIPIVDDFLTRPSFASGCGSQAG